MMRKLAVTVFAMSLTLIGCGSSSTSKKDAASDTAPDVAKDTIVVTPDTNPVTNPDTGIDTAKPTDVATDVSVIDVAKPDVTGDVTPIADTRDGSPADKTPDTFVKTDIVVIPTDAPADTTPVGGDAGSEVGGDAQVD